MPQGPAEAPSGAPGVSRRGFLGATIAVGAALGTGRLIENEVAGAPSAQAATAAALPLPVTTRPEQLHLAWGSDPTSQVTVSWAAPGSVPQAHPALAYSTKPITAENRGMIVPLPAPEPLDPTRPRTKPSAISFTDGQSGQTTYHYHVPLDDLKPDTTYYYQVSDGALTQPGTAGASFTTAPAGRFRYRFSSFGDIATPAADRSASGTSLTVYASDTSYFTVGAIEEPGDGGGAPLFHLVNGDLCYADLLPGSKPTVWRDYSVNVSRSAMNRPWMPTIGNHEVENGTTGITGAPGTVGSFNGPYGVGNYLARFLLPRNEVTNYDGNHLQGNFYSFQVGSVYFIAIDADDVIYQPGPIREYTGTMVPRASDYSLVPGGDQPNLQTRWLERTLHKARQDDSVDMIVVSMHQCPLSSDWANGTDMGIRKAWLPLFDEYQVDLVLSGHEHVFERSYPVRGYDDGDYGTAMAAFTSDEGVSYAAGDGFNTRRPTVASTSPSAAVNGQEVWDTSKGTAFYILGGGGAATTYNYQTDPATGLRKARVWTTVNQKLGWGGQQAWEDATWSAQKDGGDSYGYAVFDVDPGHGPGETTITVQWFQLPAVAEGETPVMPTTPYSKVTYGRSARWTPGRGGNASRAR